MKTYCYSLLAAGGLLLLSGNAPAVARPASSPADSPTEIQRKTARERAIAAKKAALVTRNNARTTRKTATKLNRAVLVLLGLEATRKVTSPGKLDWQLHQHQQQLKRQALHASQARKRRCTRALN
ncbi:hypothetical protein ACFP2F_12345 [Hymenobacter artigasi]|uniref:Uncharacterized protein n=1 Tax=Hymenobacter artigasi TaxID=2719616 RepID=A0ABX1HDK5_9BACT|nr:hypothetical protein [Hymenobacter artigasi]NKI88295.1 hypothetical protein [Hymenobacter artigasi]